MPSDPKLFIVVNGDCVTADWRQPYASWAAKYQDICTVLIGREPRVGRGMVSELARASDQIRTPSLVSLAAAPECVAGTWGCEACWDGWSLRVRVRGNHLGKLGRGVGLARGRAPYMVSQVSLLGYETRENSGAGQRLCTPYPAIVFATDAVRPGVPLRGPSRTVCGQLTVGSSADRTSMSGSG